MLVQLGHTSGALGLSRTGWRWRSYGPIVSPAALGRADDYSTWTAVFEAYREDRVRDAFEMGNAAGIGAYGEYAESLQIIDAECRTGKDSDITRVNDWMEVELIRSENETSPTEIGKAAEDAIRSVWKELGVRSGQPTLITVLRKDAVLPFCLERSGYVVLKAPYAKYCVPAEALDSLEAHIGALAACHAAGVLSSQAAPPWLITAAEALASVEVADEIRLRFCSGQAKWLNPAELDLALWGIGIAQSPEAASSPLAQAILIGRYLVGVAKPHALRECLAYHSPKSIGHYMLLMLSNDATRDACKRIYGHAPEYLFEQALASCCK